ncbi:hypothetical protein HYH03_001368 [Edaphochlamys debaryana]|uniref:SET domain-containing protein n=1 Tax=Edaphochlamys debaryana TaxID=47281 RepID=A0A835YL79_9CHLO|nr:hypothetical protein HYH03_001368 [Edaphochlamys debaryana]|eukprot:KAG2500600.1 hypothetical protein HYH03_001368 [Edaphochlamys debaryana]
MSAQAIAHSMEELSAKALPASRKVCADKCAAEYRPLSSGFVSTFVSDWAERRQCNLSGHNALYARKQFKAGEVLCEFGWRDLLEYPTYLTVQTGEDKHILLAPEWLEHINHSCEPNVLFNTATFKLEALREVQPGDELCFFYPSTEWAMSSPFECKCCKPSCLGLIAGASQLSREQLGARRLTDFIANRLDERDAGASSDSPSNSNSD